MKTVNKTHETSSITYSLYGAAIKLITEV